MRPRGAVVAAFSAAATVVPLSGAAVPASHMPPRHEGYRIAFTDARRGVMSATRPNVPCPNLQCPFTVYATADGGRTWRATLRAPTSPGSVAELATAPGTGVFWAAFGCDEGASCRSSLYRSGDGGRGWVRVSRTWLFAPSFGSTRHGWAIGRTGPVATRDAGRTWHRLPSDPCPSAVASEPILARASATRGWSLCHDGDVTVPDSVAVYETRNGGRTWSLRAARGPTLPSRGRGLLDAVALRGLSFSASGRGWMWKWAGTPLVTADGGRTWRPATGRRTWQFPALTWGSGPSGSVAAAIVDTQGAQMIARTANRGRTWTVVHRWAR